MESYFDKRKITESDPIDWESTSDMLDPNWRVPMYVGYSDILQWKEQERNQLLMRRMRLNSKESEPQ